MYYFSSLFLYGQLSPQLEQSPPHDVIGLPFFLAIMIAHIAPTTATTTQTMMIIVAVFIFLLQPRYFATCGVSLTCVHPSRMSYTLVGSRARLPCTSSKYRGFLCNRTILRPASSCALFSQPRTPMYAGLPSQSSIPCISSKYRGFLIILVIYLQFQSFKNRSELMDDEEGCFDRQTQCTDVHDLVGKVR